MDHNYYMKLALREAERAEEHGDVPVGAVVVLGEEILAKAHNQVELLKDPTAHAEILAITQAAAKLGKKRLSGARCYVTLEPCPMCAGAILLSRFDELIYGAQDPKLGGCGSVMDVLTAPGLNHYVNVMSGIEANSSESLLRVFFEKLRKPDEN